MNSKIVKAHCYDNEYFEYAATGKVVRVFDTNETGDLIPVAFQRGIDFNTQFNLHFAPHGTVYAEVTY
jgi:hypothetical protein